VCACVATDPRNAIRREPPSPLIHPTWWRWWVGRSSPSSLLLLLLLLLLCLSITSDFVRPTELLAPPLLPISMGDLNAACNSPPAGVETCRLCLDSSSSLTTSRWTSPQRSLGLRYEKIRAWFYPFVRNAASFEDEEEKSIYIYIHIYAVYYYMLCD
jgi:hypothetical protein